MATAIITGGGKGIGASIARCFHESGYHVVLASRQDSGLSDELGARAIFKEVDVRRRDQAERLVKAAVEWTGQLDVMVNNAGFSQWRPLEAVDEVFWDQMIDTNLSGVYWGCQAAAKVLCKGGSIVNLSSLAGKRGSANNSVYCASKFAVNGITQALAKELGGRGIRVNAVCPVYVRTEGLLEALEGEFAPPGGVPVETYLKDFAESQAALKHLPSGEEVGRACAFLASPEASAITGQCINVDCGVLPQ